MQKSLSSIGSKTMREIAMPGSHNSGMDTLTNRYYGGIEHNTLTQSVGVYNQAENGARYFDIRPVYRGKTFLTGHFSKLIGKHAGGTGTSILDIVHDINRFTSDFPGELIILDVTHDMNIDQNFRRFTPELWQELYVLLNGIADLWIPPSGDLPYDLSTAPLSTFITPGSKSSIIVRLPAYAPVPLATAGVSRRDAFISDTRLPVTNKFSDTDKPKDLSRDQIGKMRELRSPKGQMFLAAWTLTEQWLHSMDIANPRHSIIGDAARARRSLFRDLWPAMSQRTYPNIIQIDDIRDKGVLALTMAINDHFASPPQISRRDIPANETAPSETPATEYRNCTLFDKWAHFWHLYPGRKCQLWMDNKIADEQVIVDDTEAFEMDEEDWQKNQTSKVEVSQVKPTKVGTTKVEAAGLGAAVVLGGTIAEQMDNATVKATKDKVTKLKGSKERVAIFHITKTRPTKSKTTKIELTTTVGLTTKVEPTTTVEPTTKAKVTKAKTPKVKATKAKTTNAGTGGAAGAKGTSGAGTTGYEDQYAGTGGAARTTGATGAAKVEAIKAEPTEEAQPTAAKPTEVESTQVELTAVEAKHSPTGEPTEDMATHSPTSEDTQVEDTDSATPAAQTADDEIEAKDGKRAVPFRA
jgi:hypothetical protein